MITHIAGKLIEATPVSAVVEAGGIGYEVNVPVTTAEKLPPGGREVFLYTVAVYREDSQALYGFHSREDRDFFRTMVEKVSGIGPRIALNIMSRMSVPSLRGAIAASDVALLSKCPGIGKKTAERLCVELRDKMQIPAAPGAGAGAAGAAATAAGSTRQDAVAALITLGYKLPDADKAVRRAEDTLGSDATTEALIRHALS